MFRNRDRFVQEGEEGRVTMTSHMKEGRTVVAALLPKIQEILRSKVSLHT